MEAMGFGRAEIDRAMRAAFFNPDRAIEYLLNGIPENIQAEQRQAAQAGRGPGSTVNVPGRGPPGTPGNVASFLPPPANPPAAPNTSGDEPINLFEAAAQAGAPQVPPHRRVVPGGPGTGGSRGGPALNMEFLRNSPHFQQLRQLVQQQPAMLEPILQQVAEGNPQLAQMIGQNQEQFLQLLGEVRFYVAMERPYIDEIADISQQEIGGDAIGGMGETGPMPPGAVPISVTEEERDAIERLCRLGFPRDAVVQAYFACDKNEELAANFLFDQPDEEE